MAIKDERRPFNGRFPMTAYYLRTAIEESNLKTAKHWRVLDPDGPDQARKPPDHVVDQSQWDSLFWNPFPYPDYIERDKTGVRVWLIDIAPIDIDADPKPTWEEVLALFRTWQLNERTKTQKRSNHVGNYIERAKNYLVSTPVQNVRIGAGLAHMPALIHSSSESRSAGASYSPATLLGVDGELVNLWTERKQNELLRAIAERTNQAESARNTMYNRIYKDVAIYTDETKPEADRQDALDRVTASLEVATITASLEQEMQSHTAMAAAMPSDLFECKDVLLEKLEDVASEKQRVLKFAVSQQGVTLAASCGEQQDAEQKISEQKQLGQIEIIRATTLVEAQAAYDAAVTAVGDAAVPLNLPKIWEWGNPWPMPGEKRPEQKWIRTYTVKQPPGVMGNVAITVEAVGNNKGSYTIENMGTDVKVELKRVSWPSSSDFIITARNLCGQSTEYVEFVYSWG